MQPFEHIVGKKMAYEIISRLPDDTKVIVARTKGLWGSIWGKAYTGDSPKLMNVLFRSIKKRDSILLIQNFKNITMNEETSLVDLSSTTFIMMMS